MAALRSDEVRPQTVVSLRWMRRRGALSPADIAKIRAFADERSFDLAYYPGMRREEANRYNILEQPYFFDGAIALLGLDRASFLGRYKFDVSPATDDARISSTSSSGRHSPNC
jgi:hypothetical protein